MYNFHKVETFHKDIKPGNIMIESDAFGQYIVKIIDFGGTLVMNKK
jgi:serine/threonine protein kinase